MFCSNCGKELINGSNFCDNCGQAVWERTSTFDRGISFNIPQTDTKAYRLLNNFSNRVTINGIIWLFIGIDQLVTSGIRFFLWLADASDGDKGIWWILILGIINVFSAIGMLTSRKNILEKPVGIVAAHKIDGGLFMEYIWNIIVAVLCFCTGDYFFFLLAFLAVATDFFLVKLYVILHKQEFLELEEKHRMEEESKYVLS